MRRSVIGNTRSDAEASPRMALTVGGLGRRAVKFDPDRLESGLHIIERGAPQINAGNLEGIEEAAADPPIGPHSVVRAVDVRLEPDREQLEVGSRRRLQRRRALGIGAGNLRALRRDDLKFGALSEKLRQKRPVCKAQMHPVLGRCSLPKSGRENEIDTGILPRQRASRAPMCFVRRHRLKR